MSSLGWTCGGCGGDVGKINEVVKEEQWRSNLQAEFFSMISSLDEMLRAVEEMTKAGAEKVDAERWSWQKWVARR